MDNIAYLPSEYIEDRYENPNDIPNHNYDDEDNYTIDKGLRYGDMPSEMLMAKFDETNIDYDTYQPLEELNDHWRTNLRDMGPDPTTLESDQPRTDNQSKQFLNLRYHGDRAVSDVEVHHPELFLGFHGEEDREPRGGGRGTNPLEPDMKELKKQFEARMRFIRFTPDSANFVTGGQRSEAKAMADNQTVFRQARHRLKIFDTEFDGRKNGLSMNGAQNQESLVNKQISLSDDYNDMIKQAQLDRRNKTTILSNKLFRDTTEYHQNTTDHQFKVAQYGANPQRFRPYHPIESVIRDIATETELSGPQLQTLQGKAANVLMGKIIQQRQQAVQDIKNGESVQNVVSKAKAQEKDLKSLLTTVSTDANSQDAIQNEHRGRTATPSDEKSKLTTVNEEQTLNKSIATMMYKSVSEGADPVKVKSMINMDQSESKSLESTNSRGLAPLDTSATGGRMVNSVDASTVDGKSLSVGAFKSAVRQSLDSKVKDNNDQKYKESMERGATGKAARLAKNKSIQRDVSGAPDTYSAGLFDNHGQSRTASARLSEHGANGSIMKSERSHSAQEGLSEFS
jgi:hypothetical protein